MKYLVFLLFWLPIRTFATDPVVYFSPSFECENALTERIRKAENQIDIAVYSINNPRLIGALKEAFLSGKKVRVLTDGNQAKTPYSRIFELEKIGISVVRTSEKQTMHDKFAVFDGKRAVSGSFNWTQAATYKNTENCVLFDENPQTVQAYQKRFDELWNLFSLALKQQKSQSGSQRDNDNRMESIF